jgi:signal transduction histidine kinase/ActR/RegA family two-component response regulator
MLVRLEDALGGGEALERAGFEANSGEMLEGLRRVVGSVASSRLLYRAIIQWFGPRFVEFMRASYEELPRGRIRIVMEIPDDTEPSIQFFRYTLGAYRGTPRLIGQREAIVSAELTPRRATFLVMPPPEATLLERVRRGLRSFGSPLHALEELARQQAELAVGHDALLASREDVERVIDALPIGIAVLRNGFVIYANATLHETFDVPMGALVSSSMETFVGDSAQKEAMRRWLTAMDGCRNDAREFSMVSRSGRSLLLTLTRPTPIAYGGEPALVLASRETTATRAMEAELRQAQKLEAIGSLSAGIAHDFNNMLSAILGFGTIVAEELPRDSTLRPEVEQILDAARRATQLTQQLLAFARKQLLVPRVVDVNEKLGEMQALLRRVLREDIAFDLVRGAALDPVVVDPSQLEQVILNLVINARDAIAGGGRIMIETGNVVLDAAAAGMHAEATAGRYVMLAVTDTGIGMTPEVLGRAFEPFYTTKEKGAGTGLGLATVFGIVKQSGGHVWAYSEVGNGTTIKVFLPRADRDVTVRLNEELAGSDRNGDETVLLVEDDPGVRAFAIAALARGGYQVLAAADADEAFDLAANHTGVIHLLLTDVVMPGTGGPALAQRLVGVRATLQVLYMSGYAEHSILQRGVLVEGVHFLTKPLELHSLLRKVRAVLDATHEIESRSPG